MSKASSKVSQRVSVMSFIVFACRWKEVGIRGVVVNFDLAERFPRPRSQQRGSLHPRALHVAVREGVRGCHPRKFFEIFDAKSRVWWKFGPENKLIEGQPNEYNMICRNASVLAFHL